MPAAALAPPPPVVRALLEEWGRSTADPRLEVDADDEMLAYLREACAGDAEQALCNYLQSGASIASVLLQVLRWRFGDPGAVPSLLDFASGYGRVTRFLLDEVPPPAVTAADVLAGARRFQQRVLGVRALPSRADPATLALPGTYAAILVTSLFTHLPEATFGRWLAALLARLAPGGVLAFSTHHLSLLSVEQRPSAGLHFQRLSEIDELATEEYGSTWVDEPYVRRALAAAGGASSAARFPRALCNYQDLWVVVPESGETFAGLQLQAEPEVMIEGCDLGSHQLALRGWAHARHGTVAAIEVVVDGLQVGVAPVEQLREDVAAARGPATLHSGWGLRAGLPAGGSPAGSVVLLRAVDARGQRQVVWAGRLLTLALQTRSLEAREARAALHGARCELAEHRERSGREVAELRRTLAGMQASRFWKLRNAWFALKRSLRLTDEA